MLFTYILGWLGQRPKVINKYIQCIFLLLMTMTLKKTSLTRCLPILKTKITFWDLFITFGLCPSQPNTYIHPNDSNLSQMSSVTWSLQYNAVSEISGVSVFSINRMELNGMYIYPLAPNGKEY